MSIIFDYNKIDKDKWLNFVHNHPNGNIFQTPDMFSIYKNSRNCYPLIFCSIDENKDINGILLALIQKEGNGIVGTLTSRAIIWGGPLVKNNDIKTLIEIIENYKKIIIDKVIVTQFRNIFFWGDREKEIFINQGFYWEDHLDIIHDLSIDLREQYKKLHSGRKKNINRAEKYGLKFLSINNQHDDFEKVLDLILDTYKRVHLPLPSKDFFYKTREVLSANNFKIFVVKIDNKIIGTRMVLCFNRLIYDWYAGASQSHLDKYPNDYLPWKIMEWGTKNNFSVFDFGGAGKPNVPYGVRDYKLKFGGELINPGRFIFIHKPLFYKLGILGLKLFKLIKK